MEQSRNIAGKLVQLGYRLTPQRMMILQAVENSQNQLNAILGSIQPRNIDMPTGECQGCKARYYGVALLDAGQRVCPACGDNIVLDDYVDESIKEWVPRVKLIPVDEN